MSDTPDAPKPRAYSLFGRRKGRRLRGIKNDLMQTLLPQLLVAADTAIDPATLFPGASDIWLEVGFGGGEHLAAQAKAHPSIGMIGCEPFVNGVASLLDHIHREKLGNIRILDDDARPLIDHLPEASIACCFVLFPDPWPKKRHAYRRFIGPDNLPKLARIMKKGAQLKIASDDPLLQDWMEESLRGSPDFLPAQGTENGLYAARPADWPRTRYEEKALAKEKYAEWRGPRYYCFIRA